MKPHDAFRLEALVDFPDDALSFDQPVTARHIDSMMAALAEAGVQRVIWAYYGDGHGGYLLPSGIAGTTEDPSIGFDQNQWRAYSGTLDALGDPLRVAAEAAHRHGLELYAYYKPYETGIAMYFPEGSPQAREWGRLPHLGGYLTWLDPFVARNPHLRIKRRADDIRPDVEAAAVCTIRLTKKDDSPTRVTKEHLQIWTSDLNYRYRQKQVDFDLRETVEPSPREVRDVYGNLLTRKGDPVRVLTLSGLHLDDRYILVTTDFTEGAGDFENAWDRLFAALDGDGREIPGVFATGTAIWFSEWEDYRDGGLVFDTGRGPQSVVLDLPAGAPPQKTGSSVHHTPEHRKAHNFIAFARGRNDYLPGALCETEPQVQAYWLSCIGEILDAGVDGVEFRVESHSTHTDTPEDYGFNPAVLERLPQDTGNILSAMARARGDAYTDFLRRAKALIASRGRRMRVNLNLDWFRPPAERPGSRKLAYPANIEFDWQTWISEGLLDEAMLRPFATPFDAVFGEDRAAREMITACQARGIPISVNRYVWANPGLLDEFRRVHEDGRFSGFVLYETWAFTRFTREGGCLILGREPGVMSKDAPDVWRNKCEAGAMVRQVCRHWRSVGGSTDALR